MTFNPLLTVGEYNAMLPEEKRKWDDQLLDSWTEGHPTFHGNDKLDKDSRKDAAEEKENQMLGNGLET